MHVILIVGDEDVSGVYPSNRNSGSSLQINLDR